MCQWWPKNGQFFLPFFVKRPIKLLGKIFRIQKTEIRAKFGHFGRFGNDGAWFRTVVCTEGEKVNSLRLNICFTERELLLVLDKRARQRAVRLLGEVRHEQGRPELHGQRGSLSEHLRDEGEHSIEQLLVVQGRRPRPGQLGLLLPSRPGPNLKQILFKSIKIQVRPVEYTIYGHACLGLCAQQGGNYWWCSKSPRSLLLSSSFYGAIIPLLTQVARNRQPV